MFIVYIHLQAETAGGCLVGLEAGDVVEGKLYRDLSCILCSSPVYPMPARATCGHSGSLAEEPVADSGRRHPVEP